MCSYVHFCSEAISVLNIWVDQSDFLPYIREMWESYPITGGVRGLYDKLQCLKRDLKCWNLNVFGNVFDGLAAAEQEVVRQETIYDQNPTPENRMHYQASKALYKQAVNRELRFWEQKAQVKWIQSGDANTSFFHNMVKERRLRQSITYIKSETGDICDTPDSIRQEAISFFQRLFSNEPIADVEDILQYILRLLTPADNYLLTCQPSLQEVKDATWCFDPNRDT